MLKEFGLKWAEIRNVYGKYNTEQPIEKIKDLFVEKEAEPAGGEPT